MIKSYGSENGGFVLMAKTEVEGGSNWVTWSSGTNYVGYITGGDDIKDLKPCSSLTKTGSSATPTNNRSGGACTYTNESQLGMCCLISIGI